MRSTNLIIFLVLLNVLALPVNTVLGAALGVNALPGGDQAVENAANAREKLTTSRSAVDAFVGAVFMVANVFKVLGSIIFAGPEMLRNLGAPGILITGFETVLVIVFTIDLAEVLSGRDLA